MKRQIIKRIIDIIIPLLFLVGITIISSFLYLYKGICAGDDYLFHLGNIYDTYYGLTRGLSIDSSNHLMMGIYAYNTHLFYAPLPHYFAALLMVIFNCSNIVAIKASVSIFCFIGALFFYLFAKKISNSITVSLLSAAFFVFCPYRMFCGYCRFAYAETIAISILPVLFYGIYCFTHDDKPTYRCFIAIILGISGLVLSHPFTALSAAVLALAYMAVKYRATWNMLKNKKGLILSASTVLLVFMLIGFYFFPMLVMKSSDLYRVSDNEVMWTTYEHVAGSTKTSGDFSGFINIDWIKGRIESHRWPEDFPLYIFLVELGVLLGAWVLLALGDHFTNKYLKNKYLCLGLSSVALWILPLTFIWLIHDIVFYFAIIVISLIYIINKLLEPKYENTVNTDKKIITIEKEKLIDIIFLVVSTLILVLLIAVGQLWHLVPSLFYSCQFAWRLWSMVTITGTWLFIIFFDMSIKSRHRLKFISPLLIAPAILMVTTMSFREKGVALTYPEAKGYVLQEFGEDRVKDCKYIGVMNEYMPQIFYENDYKSEYANSLYPSIKETIGQSEQYRFAKEDYLSPAFLTGDGLLTCTELNTPDVVFDASINSESLIQLPQFYYDGYQITLVDKATGESHLAEVINVDSLVSFVAIEGEYTINVNYKGPIIRRVFNVFFFIGIGGIAGLSVLAVRELYREKKKKME